MAPPRNGDTCDVKELFSPQRHRLLRGEPEPPVVEAVPRSGTWRAFPDPAVKALLQEKTQQTLEVLQRCGSTLVITNVLLDLFFWWLNKKMGLSLSN